MIVAATYKATNKLVRCMCTRQWRYVLFAKAAKMRENTQRRLITRMLTETSTFMRHRSTVYCFTSGRFDAHADGSLSSVLPRLPKVPSSQCPQHECRDVPSRSAPATRSSYSFPDGPATGSNVYFAGSPPDLACSLIPAVCSPESPVPVGLRLGGTVRRRRRRPLNHLRGDSRECPPPDSSTGAQHHSGCDVCCGASRRRRRQRQDGAG